MRRWFAFGMVFITGILFMTGCRKEIDGYAVEEEDRYTTELENSYGENESDTYENLICSLVDLKKMYRWQESVDITNGVSEVSAVLQFSHCEAVPVTVQVEEYYLTKTDKQKIVECLLDKDTITFVEEKSVLQNEYALFQKNVDTLDRLDQEFDDFVVTEPEQEFIERQKEEYIEKIKGTTESKAGSLETVDYNGNCFEGKKDDISYSVSFDFDPEKKHSAWEFKVNDYDEVVNAKNVRGWTTGISTDNICNISEEEAIIYANRIMEELGYNEYALCYDATSVNWLTESNEVETNGYLLEYGLQLSDGGYNLSVDGGNANAWAGIYTKEDTFPSYPDSTIEMIVNDSGIVEMYCEGLVKIQKRTETKLLSFSQIQDCFRQEINHVEDAADIKWELLHFTYLRVGDLEKSNQYAYIPVWILDTYKDEVIVINGIDGCTIHPETQLQKRYWDYREWMRLRIHSIIYYEE